MRVRDQGAEALGHLGRRDAIVEAPDQERRDPDLAEPLLQVVAARVARQAQDS